MEMTASTPEPQSSSALTESNKRRTRRRPKQASHVVAAFVESVLREKQREEERTQVAQRRRRKRAIRKRKPDIGQLQGRESHVDAEDTAGGFVCTPHAIQDEDFGALNDSVVVVIDNLVGADELQDLDEYDDVVADLESEFALYEGFTLLQVDRGTGAVALTFADRESASRVVDAKHGKLFGGREVAARLVTTAPSLGDIAEVEKGGKREISEHVTNNQAVQKASAPSQRHIDSSAQKKPKRRSKCKSAVLRERAEREKASEQVLNFSEGQTSFRVRNLVQSDEIEDDDEFEEIKSETTSDFEQFGELVQLQVVRGTDDPREVSITVGALEVTAGDVVLEFQSHSSASAAFTAYDGKMYGGRLVECKWAEKDASTVSAKIQVENLLEPDELQDSDEFENIQDDTRQTFQQYGDVDTMTICRKTGSVTIVYQSAQSARNAIEKMDGSTHGGRKVLVCSIEDSVQSKNVLSSQSSQVRRVISV
ncbi:V-type proton atpase subunit h, partial [Globisporangium splendens]